MERCKLLAADAVTTVGDVDASAARRSETNAAQVGCRSSGCLARPREKAASSVAGSDGSSSWTDGGASCACAAASAAGLSRSNGRRPVSSSNATQASAYRSLAGEVGSPRACSGAMYPTDPSTDPTAVSVSWSAARAIPKSETRIVSSSAMSRFAGLTSRWTTPRAWALSSARAACSSHRSACSGGTAPRCSRSPTVPCVAYSITMNGRPSRVSLTS